jgi:hypothetical protein
MAREKRWVIVGNHGLYVDQRLTRAEAIAGHIYCYRGCDGIPEDISGFAIGGLNDEQRAAWKRRKKAGDRAVHATIIY